MIAAALLLAALPDAPLVLETPTQGFTPAWELVVDGGRVHRRARGAPWHLLPPAGLPVQPGGRIEAIKELVVPLGRPFDAPARVVELSADGDNLVVLDDRRRVYYVKLGTDASRVGPWTDVWGPPAFAAPLTMPGDVVAWAISHRAQAYEDIDGNPHPVSAGVTTLYSLFPSTDEHGSRIAYQDPWLPSSSWEREVCGPERGALVLVSLAASASTIAVMDDGGRVHTRLADFDTMGHNPALPYSWRRARRSGLEESVRSLPPEGWRLQPRIPGPHAKELTVFFTGEGNAKRTLRVAGMDRGRAGHWEKAVLDEAWRFVASGVAAGAVVEAREPTRRRARGERLEGRAGKARIVVEGFDLQCPGAPVVVTRGDEEVRLTLWHTERLLELDRRESDLRGALILEGDPRGKLADEIRALFGEQPVHEVEVDVHPRYVEVKSAAPDPKQLGKRPLKVRLPRASPAPRP